MNPAEGPAAWAEAVRPFRAAAQLLADTLPGGLAELAAVDELLLELDAPLPLTEPAPLGDIPARLLEETPSRTPGRPDVRPRTGPSPPGSHGTPGVRPAPPPQDAAAPSVPVFSLRGGRERHQTLSGPVKYSSVATPEAEGTAGPTLSLLGRIADALLPSDEPRSETVRAVDQSERSLSSSPFPRLYGGEGSAGSSATTGLAPVERCLVTRSETRSETATSSATRPPPHPRPLSPAKPGERGETAPPPDGRDSGGAVGSTDVTRLLDGMVAELLAPRSAPVPRQRVDAAAPVPLTDETPEEETPLAQTLAE